MYFFVYNNCFFATTKENPVCLNLIGFEAYVQWKGYSCMHIFIYAYQLLCLYFYAHANEGPTSVFSFISWRCLASTGSRDPQPKTALSSLTNHSALTESSCKWTELIHFHIQWTILWRSSFSSMLLWALTSTQQSSRSHLVISHHFHTGGRVSVNWTRWS